MIRTIISIINKGIYFIGLSCVLGIIGLLLMILGAYVSDRIHKGIYKDEEVEEEDDSIIDEDIDEEEYWEE